MNPLPPYVCRLCAGTKRQMHGRGEWAREIDCLNCTPHTWVNVNDLRGDFRDRRSSMWYETADGEEFS